MIIDFITWNVDPEIFNIGDRGIRWYGALLALGFYLAYIVFSKVLIREGFSEKKANSLSLHMILGTIIGLRVGHCFFYEPEYYLANPIEILMIWKGGLASHGGALGMIVAMVIFSIRNKLPFIGLFDRVAIAVPLAATFVRTGNLMNSEIVGKITDVSWAFYFPRYEYAYNINAINAKEGDVNAYIETLIGDGKLLPRHPSQIYEAIFYFALFLLMFMIYRKKGKNVKEGFLFGVFLTLIFGFRFLIEFVKDVQVDFEQAMSINMGQILSIPFILGGITLIIVALKRSHVVDFDTLLNTGKKAKKS